MSANERPELRAFRELESLVRNMGEELATFRRRAISAEAQLKEGGATAAGKGRGGATSERMAPDADSEALKTRLERAEDRVRQMMDRVRFLRQQLQSQSTGAGTGGGGGGRA